DLFWQNGGNPDLEPETSLQAEIGFGLKLKDLKLDLNTYYIDINELIRWVPDNSGTWRPINTAEVYNYGAEIIADWKIDISGNPLDLNGNYAYTRSIDKESNRQLIYIPEHKAALSATYAFSQFLVSLQSLYNGSIFTSTDNLYQLEDYVISNLGVGYALGKEPVTTLNFQINNLFNEKYQSLPSRIMPGRSFSTTLIIKF
ncbi:MAG: TonB-dependent receptor, partial [Gramella sp.]|nr:TonB-dependent receptor [Christiangramia sp.]